MLELDGSFGEGGGQVLRSALSLSMCTGTPFRIENIRAKRSKPGLMRQHLVAVFAAKEICDAEVIGAELNSQTLQFIPGKFVQVITNLRSAVQEAARWFCKQFYPHYCKPTRQVRLCCKVVRTTPWRRHFIF